MARRTPASYTDPNARCAYAWLQGIWELGSDECGFRGAKSVAEGALQEVIKVKIVS
jgi:hypothetical protein